MHLPRELMKLLWPAHCCKTFPYLMCRSSPPCGAQSRRQRRRLTSWNTLRTSQSPRSPAWRQMQSLVAVDLLRRMLQLCLQQQLVGVRWRLCRSGAPLQQWPGLCRRRGMTCARGEI